PGTGGATTPGTGGSLGTGGAALGTGGGAPGAGGVAPRAGGGGPPGRGGRGPGGGGGGGGPGAGARRGGGARRARPPAARLPTPPGPSGQPRPLGTPGNLTVLNWAGFKGAVTYSFDDDNDSQISNYSMLQSAGGQYTFFLWTGRTQASNAIWKQALNDGHEIG